jgi:predicted MFS family arabinose efflux permease
VRTLAVIMSRILPSPRRRPDSALVTDTAPREALDLGLSWLWGIINLGTVIGSPLTGWGLQYLGQRSTFLIALLAPLAAIVLLVLMREPTKRPAGAETAAA